MDSRAPITTTVDVDAGHARDDRIAVAQPADTADIDEITATKPAPPEEMTLNIARNSDRTGEPKPGPTVKLLSQGPNGVWRPENYVIRLTDLSEEPEFIDCPYCHSRQRTRVVPNDNGETATAALCCCIFCGGIGACIPILCHWGADTDHYCSGCRKHVARKLHGGKTEPIWPQAASGYKPSQYQPIKMTVPTGKTVGSKSEVTKKEPGTP
ncbi:hypothetical protein MFIFM68171_05777 [Madurella fahalii]|uniref:LITAF domain-containing protein n=1 Tax=Madurella fahalii TaxID=1157608 RepID=A0ABQ0GCU9_9PEZI